MSTRKTFGTVLKRFQQDAVDNGIEILRTCLVELSMVQGTREYAANRNLIIADVGAILIEAPTGVGKTLIAGHIAQGISQLHNTEGLPKIIWFWFAPFDGLIGQATRVIRTEFDTLRTKNPATDREPIDLKSGDVFVATWASVAVATDVKRKTRTNTETMPSIDGLIAYARGQGFSIGAVIDEAHHTFRSSSQAFAFYINVLSPDLTILATATPRDKDVTEFTKAAGISNLRRITVSRQQAIDDHLIKVGVKVAVFKAPIDVESLIDFKKTALKQGVATHKKLKQELSSAGISMTPLLLVQMDSQPGSIEEATDWLKEMGFRTDGDSQLIRSHTALEPDPYLSTIAADETVEVLVFKLAVAIGFDAPRAFTLVSFRPSRDPDFGVQIVGRILRVDRRLQVVRDLPPALMYGYVFLSDNAGQTGLSNAAQRINAVKTELASVTSNVSVISIGEEEPEAQITKNGQSTFLAGARYQDSESAIDAGSNDDGDGIGFALVASSGSGAQDALFEAWGLNPQPVFDGAAQNPKTSVAVSDFNYPLQPGFGAPPAFLRAILSLDSTDIVSDVVNRFRFDDDSLLVAQQNAATTLQEVVEIFGNTKERPEEIRGDLAQKEVDARAQQSLFKADDYDAIDIRELHQALTDQFRKELERKGIEHNFDSAEKVRAGLHKILALRPLQLKRAISEAVAKYTTTENAAEIPSSVTSFVQLDAARLNLYGIFPDDLNTWERPFAEYLDNDLTGAVLWWHRNPVRKPFSVSMPLPGQPDFYPDFVVGIRSRTRGAGILLMETKRVINDQERNALVKAQAEHPVYGKVMMLYWQDKREWQVVEYDDKDDRNYLDRVLRTELLATY